MEGEIIFNIDVMLAKRKMSVTEIELFNAAQALDFRRPLKSSPAVEAIHAAYRKVVPFIVDDEVMYPHIAQSIEFLK